MRVNMDVFIYKLHARLESFSMSLLCFRLNFTPHPPQEDKVHGVLTHGEFSQNDVSGNSVHTWISVHHHGVPAPSSSTSPGQKRAGAVTPESHTPAWCDAAETKSRV